eukprot:CAMPEP_0182563844 /NCGR_PEP_ID=MMETSP1324-20130603/5912_1 /TAXON_ID=236786 /ORGANISM="Florenciella sp., Strain RCC1587" /LENGTH=35 /DNA_ID= /DNA_START= /DNA_END= /DNA_ORIENTATION=
MAASLIMAGAGDGVASATVAVAAIASRVHTHAAGG